MAELASLNMIALPDGRFTTIQSAINYAANNPRAVVWINPYYAGSDSYINPSSVPIFDMRGAGSLSFASGGASLNSPNTWTAIQTFVRTAEGGTALSTSNFSLVGWGTGAAMSALAGFDGAHIFTVTAGSAPSASPTITLTYVNGSWTIAPIVTAQMTGGTGQIADITIASTATTYTLTFNGQVTNTQTYVFSVLVKGLA